MRSVSDILRESLPYFLREVEVVSGGGGDEVEGDGEGANESFAEVGGNRTEIVCSKSTVWCYKKSNNKHCSHNVLHNVLFVGTDTHKL